MVVHQKIFFLLFFVAVVGKEIELRSATTRDEKALQSAVHRGEQPTQNSASSWSTRKKAFVAGTLVVAAFIAGRSRYVAKRVTASIKWAMKHIAKRMLKIPFDAVLDHGDDHHSGGGMHGGGGTPGSCFTESKSSGSINMVSDHKVMPLSIFGTQGIERVRDSSTPETTVGRLEVQSEAKFNNQEQEFNEALLQADWQTFAQGISGEMALYDDSPIHTLLRVAADGAPLALSIRTLIARRILGRVSLLNESSSLEELHEEMHYYFNLVDNGLLNPMDAAISAMANGLHDLYVSKKASERDRVFLLYKQAQSKHQLKHALREIKRHARFDHELRRDNFNPRSRQRRQFRVEGYTQVSPFINVVEFWQESLLDKLASHYADELLTHARTLDAKTSLEAVKALEKKMEKAEKAFNSQVPLSSGMLFYSLSNNYPRWAEQRERIRMLRIGAEARKLTSHIRKAASGVPEFLPTRLA